MLFRTMQIGMFMKMIFLVVLIILQTQKIICKNGLYVSDYINNYAIPYFANQTFRIREGYYRHGEYSHGILERLNTIRAN